jgi:7,8-dihydropterin-6-yl-methyl-4-(beta-D-ribofuranosyl)aminobenzene 5'-phosphate synthase
MTLKIIFDKEKEDPRYSSGWGISYLIDGRVLFDAGERAEYILDNARSLNVDLRKIEKIVISHNHWDHRGGLWGVLDVTRDAKVFACRDFFDEFKEKIKDYHFSMVADCGELAPGVYTTGCLRSSYKGRDLYEQALVLETEGGISLLCGCAHPGVLEYIARVREMFPSKEIYAVIGGMHLMDTDRRSVSYIVEKIKEAGVANIGPSHCTGFEATNIFREYYAGNFLEIKVGKEFEL